MNNLKKWKKRAIRMNKFNTQLLDKLDEHHEKILRLEKELLYTKAKGLDKLDEHHEKILRLEKELLYTKAKGFDKLVE